MTDQPAIRFERVGQTFDTRSGRTEALRNVSFEVGRHEFLAILGPSGCGKSTLLRLIAGLLKPTAGRLEVFDLPSPSRGTTSASSSRSRLCCRGRPWRTMCSSRLGIKGTREPRRA